jgi:hypothetical protein
LLLGFANKCLDVEGGQPENRTRVVLFDCHGGDNQRWSFVAATPSFGATPPSEGRIVGLGGKCLDVEGGSAASGMQLILFDCGTEPLPRPNQRRFVRQDFHLVSGLASDMCSDVFGGNSANRTPIILFNCHPGPNQMFRFAP